MTTTPQLPSDAHADDGAVTEEKAPSRLVPAGRFAWSVLRMPSGLFGVLVLVAFIGMALLVTTGHALEFNLGDGASARYDANTDRHDHAVCDRCGRAVDIDHPIPSGMVTEIARSSGFFITGYDLQFRGLCPACSSPAGGADPPREPEPVPRAPAAPTTHAPSP